MSRAIAVFRLRERPSTPVNVELITPSRIAGLTDEELRSLPVYLGGRITSAEAIFDIECPSRIDISAESVKIVFEGAGTEKLWFVGANMNGGSIEVRGDVGPFLGYRMVGGRIEVHGDAREWLGASMSGGIIVVRGSAGDFVGARPFFGGWRCMTGGRIYVGGNAGSFVGFGMLGGYIEVGGDVGDFLGLGMRGGVIVVHCSAGLYPGLEMRGGLIVIGGGAEGIAVGFHEISLGARHSGKSNGVRAYVGDALSDGDGLVIALGNAMQRCTLRQSLNFSTP